MSPQPVDDSIPGSGPATRARRADAQRNVAAILEAAKVAFARDGVDVPAKVITDSAGVGVGTLYRHFPRRSDLIVAVLQHDLDNCVAAAVELAGSRAARDALEIWLERFTDFVRTKHGLAAALHSGDPAYEDLPRRLLDQMVPALQMLLAEATTAGDARSGDPTAREVLTAVALMCQPVPDAPADFSERMVRIFVDGLAPRKP